MYPRVLAVLGCIASSMAFSVPAASQDLKESERSIQVLEQKSLIRYHRFELVPTFTLALNENLTRHFGVGAQARFHVTDEWSVGAEYIKYFGRLTNLATDLADQYQSPPEERLMNHYFGVQGGYVPALGKFLFFGLGPVHWDMNLIAGLGATRTGAVAYRVTGNVGLGFRFLVWKFLTLNLEVRDFMYMEKFNAGDRFINNVVFTAGIGIFAPFYYDYEFPK